MVSWTSRRPTAVNASEIESLRRRLDDELADTGHVKESRALDAFDKVAMALLAVLVFGVILKMALRDWNQQWEVCDPTTVLNKHEYCINSTRLELARR